MNEKRTENNQDGQSNFKAALQELLGKNKAEEEEFTPPVMEQTVPEKRPQPRVETPKRPYQPSPDNTSGTVIAEDVIIDGSISSKTDIYLSCVVKGNVTSDSKVFISGNVEGDVTGSSIVLKNAEIKGNLICQNDINLDQGSVLVGDVKCQRLDSNGKIEGSVEADGAVILRVDSEVHGNLAAQSLSVQDGSIINGSVSIRRERKLTTENINAGFNLDSPIDSKDDDLG